MTFERKLRFVQIVCFGIVGACVLLTKLGQQQTSATTTAQWVVIVCAIWCAVSGFTLQRKLTSSRVQSQKSTPYTRWRAGHLWRLWSATSVGLWALLLHEIGGPSWVIGVLFTISMLLLLLWKPGSSPSPQPQV